MCCQFSLHNITVTFGLVNTQHERVTPTICFAFVLCSHRKIITIRIFDREEYEKECSFSLVLEEPKWIRRGMKGVRAYKDIPARNCTLLSPCLPTLTLNSLLFLGFQALSFISSEAVAVSWPFPDSRVHRALPIFSRKCQLTLIETRFSKCWKRFLELRNDDIKE